MKHYVMQFPEGSNPQDLCFGGEKEVPADKKGSV